MNRYHYNRVQYVDYRFWWQYLSDFVYLQLVHSAKQKKKTTTTTTTKYNILKNKSKESFLPSNRHQDLVEFHCKIVTHHVCVVCMSTSPIHATVLSDNGKWTRHILLFCECMCDILPSKLLSNRLDLIVSKMVFV